MTKRQAGQQPKQCAFRPPGFCPGFGCLFVSASVIALAVLLNGRAVEASQRLVAWGDINYDLTAPDNAVAGIGTISQISAGAFHSLALMTNGTIVAWGDNRFNQTNVPTVFLSKPAVAIAAGNVHNLALLASGNVLAWGPAPGQTGDYGQCAVPAGLGNVIQIAAGAVHSLALKADGTVVAWGANLNGQCNAPAGLDKVIAVAGGMYHSLALRQDGTVVAWGDNTRGQSTVPAGLGGVVAIAAGGNHSLALTTNGTVVSWGAYGLAQCDVPAGLSNVAAIATGDLHSLALKRDGTLVSWGFNTSGQCDVPAGLAAITNIVGIAALSKHSMVLIEEPTYTVPELRIQVSEDAVLVSWPAAITEGILEQNPGLNPANWTPVVNLPKVVGARYTVSLPPSPSMFFRLVHR